MNLTGMRIAVTGASGFCGSAVALAAAGAGADVVCLSRRPGPVGSFVPWDAAHQTPDLAGADAVIHLAAAVGDQITRPDTRTVFQAVNVDGTARLLDAARGRPVIWVSSASVYDPRMARHRVHEDHPIGGQLTEYGRTKAAGDTLALAAGAVVLRPRAVYGSGDPYLLPRLRARVRWGRIALPGPDVRLSLTAVENLADACLASLSWPAGAYNVTDARPYQRDAAIREVLAALGIRAAVVRVPPKIAYATARLAEVAARLSPAGQPVLSRYAVDQLAHEVVLDIGKVTGLGWRPRHCLAGFLETLAPNVSRSRPRR